MTTALSRVGVVGDGSARRLTATPLARIPCDAPGGHNEVVLVE